MEIYVDSACNDSERSGGAMTGSKVTSDTHLPGQRIRAAGEGRI